MPDPRTADIFAEAVALHRTGKLEAARDLYRQVLGREPRHGEALELLGLVHAGLGETADAIRVLEQAADVAPRSINAVFNLAMALKLAGRLADAEARFRRAVRLKPDLAHAHLLLGQVQFAQYRPAEAESSYREALRLDPKLADAHLNLGQALALQGRLREAVAAYGQAASLEPKSAQALAEQGRTLIAMSRGPRAAEVLERAVRIEPGSRIAWTLFGTALRMGGRMAEALVAFERAQALEPDAADTLFELVMAKRTMADWRGLEALTRQAEAVAARPDPASTSLFALAVIDDPAAHQKAARAFTRHVWPAAAVAGPDPAAYGPPAVARPKLKRRPEGRLAVGYVSSDLGNHPVGYALAGLLAAHDRARVEVHAISTRASEGQLARSAIRDAADRLHGAEEMSGREFAGLVREAGIDILVDLNGHFAGSTAHLFVARPAPVQVSFLGYPATMGFATMDYIIADATVLPPGDERHYDEKVVRLPHCYLPNDLSREAVGAVPRRADQGLPEGATVLAAFHGAHKLTPEVFGCWMRVLRAVEGSVLWLSSMPAAVAANLRREAEARGVGASRLVFASHVAARADHLARHRLADLFLDCAPYNAHTTAADALWMGLPVVTLVGRAFPGRVAASLLHGAGLGDLATTSLADYEACALRLAQDPAARAAIASRLAAGRTSQPLWDMARFARGLEWAYARMAVRAADGAEPAGFDVPAAAVAKGASA